MRSCPIVPDNNLELTPPEQKEAEAKSSVTVRVVHEAVRREGEEELNRTPSALAWSGLAAGLSMGFSLIGEAVLRSKLPDVPWRPLIAKFGYSTGFVIVILGRQQLFTENTLTPILPLLHRRDMPTLIAVARLWAVVLISNLIGALAIAWVLGNTPAFDAGVQKAFAEIGKESLGLGFGLVMLRGVFAGWLIALLVWVLPFAETGRFFVIVALTWVIGIGGFTHVIAGSIEVLFLATTGAASLQHVVLGYILPALIGNIIGGVSLVAALNHAQTVS
ncbi:MAG: formate/nitrite transporter family protein [Acidobacteriota bacterium]|nr:formate/nitrite transporter family protein [Acidobacteriota bacterium]